MNKKTPKTINESILEASSQHRERLFAPFSHQQSPSLLLRDSFIHSNTPQTQLLNTSRRAVLADWGIFQTPATAKASQQQEILTASVTKSINRPQRVPSKHRRSNSTLEVNSQVPSKKELESPKPKQESMSNRQSSKKVPGLGESQKMPSVNNLVSTPQQQQRKFSHSLIPSEFLKGTAKSKESQELIDSLLSPLKGVVFSDTKNRFAKYQRRFIELNGQSVQQENSDALSTPKTVRKLGKSVSKGNIKVVSSKESQLIGEGLSQLLQINSPQNEVFRPNTPSPISAMLKKKGIPVEAKVAESVVHSAKGHKRGTSWGHVVEQSSRRPSKEDLVKKQQLIQLQQQEEAKLEQARAEENELEYYNKLLSIGEQEFGFEKMMVMRRQAKKNQQSGPLSLSGVINGEGNNKDKEAMLRSMFAYYSKDSGNQQGPTTGESSKNGQGSTTCNSSKVISDGMEGKKEKKKKGEEEEKELEELLEAVGSQKGTRKSHRRNE